MMRCTAAVVGARLVCVGGCRKLDLRSNNLVGTLPNTLSALTNLQYLYLHVNSLTGTIPSTIGALTALVKLYLHTNAFTGSLPLSLGSAALLSYVLVLLFQRSTTCV
jgi:hypothetical protein